MKTTIALLVLALASPSVPRETAAVEWHDSYAEALEAAAESGKPVLLFQLLGRLDEEFC